MKAFFLPLILLVGLVASPPARPAQSKQTAPLRLVQTIPLPDVEGRIDHLTCDVKGQRLFVSALGNNTLEVVDLKAGKRATSVHGLKEPQGVLYLPQNNRVYVANGQGEGVDVFEASAFKKIQSLKVGDDSDNVRYDPSSRQIIVGFGGGGFVFFNASTGKWRGNCLIHGHPESFQLESKGTRLFVNVPNGPEGPYILAFDRKIGASVGVWNLKEAAANYPMALDEAHHRLFVGCRKPAKLLVYDTESGKVVTSLDIVADTDDLFYDVPLKRLYVAGGGGAITVFQQTDANHYRLLASLPTADGARTGLFVPALKRFYLAVPHRGSQGAEIRVYETVQ